MKGKGDREILRKRGEDRNGYKQWKREWYRQKARGRERESVRRKCERGIKEHIS